MPPVPDADLRSFEQRFGGGARLAVVAPGRVNLIGEHTDYHDGLVLPAAIERAVRVLARPRPDAIVELYSASFGTLHRFDLSQPMPADLPGWARRAEGIVREVLASADQAVGFQAFVDADLPLGGGLSSSAASMAALGTVAARANGRSLEPLAFARTLQQAEHTFAGVRCGIMDQLAVLLGKRDHALLLDCRSLETRHVALPPDWALVVLDTGVKHDLATSEYNRRQEECASGLSALRRHRPSIRALRDATEADLDAVAGELGPVAQRRCRHVVAEDARVLQAVEALARADAPALRSLFEASHQSLRDGYEVSCPELDAMVEAARGAPGCLAARMTGGGFGGSTVNLVERPRAAAFADAALAAYRRATGRDGRAIVTRAADGVRAFDL
ncbi:MAG TPA: galactokinase [Myxococcales bacterium]|jgi:galactokinase